jgi:hypothetical protein
MESGSSSPLLRSRLVSGADLLIAERLKIKIQEGGNGSLLRRTFDARAGCVVDQFNSIDVGNGLHHNGRLVLGEALGDLGGVAVALKAYRHSLAGKPAPTMDGFTASNGSS